MVQLAWAFVVVRIVHSLVQLTINIVLLRFVIFAIGWLIIAYGSFLNPVIFSDLDGFPVILDHLTFNDI